MPTTVDQPVCGRRRIIRREWIGDTIDTDYAAHRQRFRADQGYAYTIADADDVLGPKLPTVD
ncbi:hypothetical protein AB0F73_11655 [Micromonospora purpureochromogenes]|uniref:hypothetical protein n=1 Tax=Micromonospora purpureochromogenes TaxID=47872 RepID=UPI0033ED5CB4